MHHAYMYADCQATLNPPIFDWPFQRPFLSLYEVIQMIGRVAVIIVTVYGLLTYHPAKVPTHSGSGEAGCWKFLPIDGTLVQCIKRDKPATPSAHGCTT